MSRILAGILSLALPVCALMAQGVGPNVNMVACTPGPNNEPCPWPKGDPFLERQNEPALALSSRNSAHLVGGANDYRTVDIPGLLGIQETGDVWVGLYKSYDGGGTWRSTLVPGYPLDNSPEGLASPVHGFQASADPTVRAGTNGLFFYSFIAFNRNPTNALGAVAVARLIDNNNKENFNPNKAGSDPIQYLSTSIVDNGTAGQFLDKPWLVADIPRAGAGTCTINGKSFAAGNVYLTYSKFVGSDTKPSSQILLVKSLDCGASWSKPIKISESNSRNQGTVIALDPRNGNVYVAWRRSAVSSQPDAIVIAKSTDGGSTFTKGIEVQTFVPDDPTVPGRKSLFDQPKISSNGITYSFRAKAFPTMAVDGSGRVYVAWSQRGLIPAAPLAARIVVATSADGVTFTSPTGSQVIADPNTSPAGYYQGPYYGVGGHQFMPVLAFANGVVMLAYYDSREDHTTGTWMCLDPSTGQPNAALSCPVTQRVEVRVPVGNLASSPPTPSIVFTDYISDLGLGGALLRRHTIDVRAAQAFAAGVPVFAQSVRVSQYKFGTRPGGSKIEQLGVNPPNFPMFVRGTSPFTGDYVDLAALNFVTDANGNWTFNTSTAEQPVFHATWADNRDVRPPADGNWANFTPTVSSGDSPAGAPGGASLFGDPSNPTRPACAPGQAGIRNQNIYTARISQGLVVTSRGNSKQITNFARAYTLVVQNTTFQCKSFRVTLPSPTNTVTVSFTQLFPGVAPLLTLNVTIAPRSSIAREVFIKSSIPKPNVKAQVVELATNGNCSPSNLSSIPPLSNGLTASYAFNPDPTSADIASADISSADISSADISTSELYFPAITSADITSADITSADITNPEILSADISSADITNADIANAVITSADISSADISSADISSADISSADISGALGDVTWSLINLGNTSASFNTKLFLKGVVNQCVPQNCGTTGQPACTPGCAKFQLILHKQYRTPVASINGGCTLMSQFQNQVIANIVDPAFLTTGASLTSADISSADISNATVALAPGEDAQVTVRVFSAGGQSSHSPIREASSFARIAESLVSAVSPTSGTSGTSFTTVGGAQAVGTTDAANGITTPAVTLTVVTTALPDGITGQPYSAAITAVGGNIGTNTNLTWSPATLGDGLQLATEAGVVSPNRARGLISGSPVSAAPSGFSFTVQVVDAPPASPPAQQTATQTLSIRVGDPLLILPATVPDGTVNVPVSFKFGTSGGLGAVSFAPVSLPAWLALSPAGVLSGIPPASGNVTISFSATDSSCLVSITACQTQIANATLSFKINPRKTSMQLVLSKNPVAINESLTATATVTDIDTAPALTPAGTVTIGASSCTLAGSGPGASCSVTLSFGASGPQTIAAAFAGNSVHAPSQASVALGVNPRQTSTKVTLSKNPVVVNESVTATATVTDIDAGTQSAPTGDVTIGGSPCTLSGSGTSTSCSVTLVFGASGPQTIAASYAGTAAFTASTGSASLQVNTRSTSTALSPNPATMLVGQPTTLTITVTDTQAEGTKAAPAGTIGLTSTAADALSGCVLVPGAAGVSSCTVTATFNASGARTITAAFAVTTVHSASSGSGAVTANPRPTTITIGVAPSPVAVGTAAIATVTVTDTGAYQKYNPSGTIALSSSAAGDSLAPCVLAPTGTLGIAACSAAVTPATAGTRTISAGFALTPVHSASGPATATLVAKYAITLSLSATPNPTVPLQTITAQFTGSYTAPVAPTGSITVADGEGNSCTAPVGPSGSCTLSASSPGTKTLTAGYPGDANFLPAQATATEVVQTYGFTGFLSPLNGTESYSGSANLGNAVPVKWQLADAGGAPFVLLNSTKSLKAVFTGGLVGGTCPVSSTGQSFVLYSPTLGATGGSTYRIDPPSNTFIFNWDTTFVQSAGVGCYTLVLDLADGTTKRTSLNLK